MTKEKIDNDCTNCPAFNICPEKPVREDYADENEYLIDLECGVWSCRKTIEKLCKENDQLNKAKEIIKKYYKYNPSCEYFYEDIDKEAEQFLNSEVEE